MAALDDIVQHVNRTLVAAAIPDYCPNGLQVEGRSEVATLISGVTACEAFLEAAIDAGADAVLVHHGYFWKNDSPTVTGMLGRRVRRLVKADVSLMAWHLPLDVDPVFGNNAEIGRRLGIEGAQAVAAGGTEGLLWFGDLTAALGAEALAERIDQVLARRPLVVADHGRPIRRFGWCSGGAQGFLADAARLGCDAYLSGEISEKTMHEARELGVTYFHAGHHASERFGVQALGEHLADHFSLTHRFIDIDNPA
ncbi:MAG: Nif3-like dinuclear metal center hexameric protein [Gammaproteobacteria bacterium]|nr:MAG: Nif3-like dinuclear metal center hexameric protein [Gammaproteobacteria bacterium]